MISDGKKITQDERTSGTKRPACMGQHPCKTVHPGRDMKTSERRETRLPQMPNQAGGVHLAEEKAAHQDTFHLAA